MGKSRIIATVALLIKLWINCGVVHIVFPNQLLCDRDKKDFEDYFKLGDFTNFIKYQVGLNFSPAANDFLILDEGDFFIYDDISLF